MEPPKNLAKYPQYCDKHSESENAYFCKDCDTILCLECTVDHGLSHSDHKLLSIAELAITAIRQLEGSKKKIESGDALYQEFLGQISTLSEKVKNAEATALKFKAFINSMIDNYLNMQFAQLTDLKQTASQIKEKILENEKQAELISKRIANVKKLCAEKKFGEIIGISKNACEEFRQVPLEEVKSKFSESIESVQINIFSEMEDAIRSEFSAFLDKYSIIYQGCTVCKKADNRNLMKKCSIHSSFICSECAIQCRKCGNLVCKKCAQKPCAKNCGLQPKCLKCIDKCRDCHIDIGCEKCDFGCVKCNKCLKCLTLCEKCGKKVCSKCHDNCTGKFVWYNGNDTFVSQNENVLISSKHLLPKFFKVEIEVKDFVGCNWGLGISEKQYDGSDECSKNGRISSYVGYVKGLKWNEYAQFFCSCNTKCFNGDYIGGNGRLVNNGKITLVLDKSRNLNLQIDGESKGILYSNIIDATYYLSYGGSNGVKGQLKILSIEELK